MILIPEEKQHYNIFTKNKNFYNLNTKNFPSYPEWGLIIMFYEIIHLIERVLAIAPIQEELKHPKNHVQRYQTMKKLRKFITKDILSKYRTLKNISFQARYEYGIVDSDTWTKIKNHEYKELKEYFQILYKDINKLMKK